MVIGDRWLRWVGGGYALAFLLNLPLSIRHAHPDELEALAILALLAVPVVALSAPASRRSGWWLLLPTAVFGAAVAAVLTVQPDLLDGNQLRPGTRVAWAVAAILCLAAAVLWLRPAPGCREWVGVGLVVAAAAGLLHALAKAREDNLWWAGVAAEALALLIPAVAIGLRTALGFGRQSRRWRQLEAEVKALRRGTRLLPGRSVTPEDDEGLPGAAEVRAILDAAAVRVALQPVLELPTGAIVGNEALSRFGGRVPTDRWFKAASKHGYGAELERLCLGAALELLPTLPAEQFLAVNISPAALVDPGVLALLDAAELRRIVVEVTEHEAVEDYALTR